MPWCIFVVLGISTLFYVVPELSIAGMYDRDLIAKGEWWRLFLLHFVHLTPQHFSLNGLTLLVLGLVAERADPPGTRLAICGTVAVVGPVYAVAGYAGDLYGLSAINAGLLAVLLFIQISYVLRQRRWHLLALFAGAGVAWFLYEVRWLTSANILALLTQTQRGNAGKAPIIWGHFLGATSALVACTASRCAARGRSARTRRENTA